MNLVIVESPTKARTIGRFLGKEYDIKASMGHIMDLPKSTLGVDVDKNFAPLYEVLADKKKIISELKAAAKDADQIILATDPDREGEAIAAHVRDVLSSSLKLKVQNAKFQRIVFHEITKEAIEEALQHPGVIDTNLVNAQTARRILDRLVGYKLSLLWQKYVEDSLPDGYNRLHSDLSLSGKRDRKICQATLFYD
jgi:DNA topoisomerase-1